MNGVKEKVKSFDKSRRRKKKYLGKLIPKEEEYFEINKTFDYGIRKRTQLEKNPKKKNSKNNIIENGKKRIYKLDYCDKNSNCQLDLNNSFEENKENVNNENTIKDKKNSNKNNNTNSKNINCNGSEKINDTFIEVSFSKRKKRKIRKLKNDNLSKSFDNIQNNRLISKANINLAKSKNNHDINKGLDIEKNQKSLISVKHFSSYEQIKNMEMDNVVSSILEINSSIFCIGSFIGKIKLFNLNTFYEILRFTSHEGAINSLFLLNDNSILSASSDKTMKKISFKNNYKSYSIDFIFNGFNNILKGIELENNYNIISFSNNKKIYFWVKDKNKNNYKNSFIHTERYRILDLLGISNNEFASLSEIELKFWSSNSFDNIYKIKINKNYGNPKFLCKINKEILCLNYNQYVSLINVKNKNIINTIKICDGELTQMIQLNDESLLIAEGKIFENHIIFYIKQYEYIGEYLNYISFKRNKSFKKGFNGNKEIRGLFQFSNGIIVQNICNQNNEKDFSELIFYK